jgi:hypothetical protein
MATDFPIKEWKECLERIQTDLRRLSVRLTAPNPSNRACIEHFEELKTLGEQAHEMESLLSKYWRQPYLRIKLSMIDSSYKKTPLNKSFLYKGKGYEVSLVHLDTDEYNAIRDYVNDWNNENGEMEQWALSNDLLSYQWNVIGSDGEKTMGEMLHALTVWKSENIPCLDIESQSHEPESITIHLRKELISFH